MTAPTMWQGPETVVPGALRGYRSFRVGSHEDQAALLSTGVPNAWTSPTLTARCLKPTPIGTVEQDCACDFCEMSKHASPQADCACGIYGWYRPDDTRIVRANVLAVVEVSGRVILGTHGFRAEKVRIVALSFEYQRERYSLSFYDDDAPRHRLHDIARWCKDNGIQTFATNAEMIEAYPPEDVSALVQHDCTEDCDAHPRPTGSTMSALSSSISFSLGANTTAFAKAIESASTYTYQLATEAPSAPPRWKRYAALVGCLLAFLFVGSGAALTATGLATDGPSWGHGTILAIQLFGVVFWPRVGRKAWRWGR